MSDSILEKLKKWQGKSSLVWDSAISDLEEKTITENDINYINYLCIDNYII